MSKRLILWLPVLLWCIVIFTFSSFPTGTTSTIEWQDFIVKKLAHIFVYGVLSLLTYRALLGNGVIAKKAGVIAIVLAFIYGVTDEIHQSFTPGRFPRIYDIVFDTIGASLSIYFIWKLLPRMPKKLINLAKDLQLI